MDAFRSKDSTPQPSDQVAEQRKKFKRRSEQPEPISLPRFENLEVKGEKTPPRKAIKQQNYTILNGVFNSRPDSTTKIVDWDAFVTAIADAGFAARQSSGSAVIFEPHDWEMGWSGKILFHKPHPVAKIDSIMLRSVANRTEKWFGWDGETFVIQY
ncbi:hypothetical protein F5882DRAFT_501659 [Hyaloscypha sp. PMI_1271]|nr:hypothetical protein F5882DRAFT_501659 [Hyaloscypha sp. PMI_1271]